MTRSCSKTKRAMFSKKQDDWLCCWVTTVNWLNYRPRLLSNVEEAEGIFARINLGSRCFSTSELCIPDKFCERSDPEYLGKLHMCKQQSLLCPLYVKHQTATRSSHRCRSRYSAGVLHKSQAGPITEPSRTEGSHDSSSVILIPQVISSDCKNVVIAKVIFMCC